MKIGIVGYGNLGRAAEINAKNLGYEITGIFSRRNVTSPFGTKVFDFKNFGSFDTETDIMLLCGGSKTNLREQSRIIAKRFNTADTFDTHAEIAEHIKELDDIQVKTVDVSQYNTINLQRELAESMKEWEAGKPRGDLKSAKRQWREE